MASLLGKQFGKIILTLDLLKRRDWSLPKKYYLCKGEEESTNHILLHCLKVSMLWHLILAIFDVQWVMPFSIKDALISWRGAFVGKKRKKARKTAPLCLFWTLWKERNQRAFKDSELTDHTILCSFMYMFLEWVRVHIEFTSLFLLDFID